MAAVAVATASTTEMLDVAEMVVVIPKRNQGAADTLAILLIFEMAMSHTLAIRT